MQILLATGGATGVVPSKLSLLHFEGTNGGTTFTDEMGLTWTPAGGGATTSTSQFKFGASSLSLNGASRITTPIAGLPFGSNDMTIACWVRPTAVSTYQNIFNSRGSSSGGVTFRITNGAKIEFFWGAGTNAIVGTTNISAGVWTHVAMTRASNVVRTFVGGNLENTVNVGANSFSTLAHTVATIGCYGQQNVEFFSGFIDEYIICDNALWTASFTPPSAPYSPP